MLGTDKDDVCLPPKPPQKPERFAVPPGAWDCHAHVIGKPPEFPYVDSRHYTPRPFSPADFLKVLDLEGIQYGVAVQISVHGTDNSYLIEALKRHPDRLRGVAVIDASMPDRALSEMKDAGVVGIRLLEAKGGVGTADLERLDARCAELGWHIQLCVEGKRYPDLLPRLLRLKSRLVVDHMGWFDIGETSDGPSFQAVLNVLGDMDAWLKMSGGFRLSREGAPYQDTVPFMKKLIKAAPDRLVWGSDWPHVAITNPDKIPQYGALLDLLSDATEQPAVIKKLLVENPVRLYGRPPPATRAS